MSHSRQFLAHSFLFVFLALLLIILLLSGAVFFLTREQFVVTAGQSAGYDAVYFTPTVDRLEDQEAAESDVFAAEPGSPEGLALFPVSSIPGGLITNGARSEYKIALTFDVCQREGDLAGFDTEIVRILSEMQTPATFFLGGQWIRDHPWETQQLEDNPLFELGNHSWSHLDFSVITRQEMNREILLAQQEMGNLLGYQTNLFRLPYGTYTEEALQVIAENGLYVIQWDVVSGDPDPNIDAARMTTGVLGQIQPGSIVIMHANERGWHTAEALPGIIQSLQQQGYELVTVSDLLGIPSAR